MKKNQKKYKRNQRGYLTQQFKTRPRKQMYVIHIGTEWDTRGLNEKIATTLGRDGHEAIEQIRKALLLWISTSPNTTDPEFIASTNKDWSPVQQELWSRFMQWHRIMRETDVKAREAVIHFCKGEKPTAIDRLIRVRNGTSVKKIITGVKVYVDLMREEINKNRPQKKKTSNPVPKPEFKVTKIIEFVDV